MGSKPETQGESIVKNAESQQRELERLAALAEYRVLDSQPEAVYDAITRLAAQICGVPIAIISLVDRDRLWFKAVEGWPGVSELPRQGAFCECAVEETGLELLEVRDATRDARFRDHPLVTHEPKIRFYAGIPLATAQGHRLGTLCVLDTKVGALSAVQHAALRQLSEVAMQLLESRKSNEQFSRLEQAERHFRATFEQAAVGMAHTTLEGAFIEVNSKLCDMLGYEREELMRMTTLALSRPDDRGRYAQQYQEIAEGKRELFSGEKQWVRRDGSVIWVNRTVSRAGTVGDAQPYLIQVIEDISERKRIEFSLARLARARRVMAEVNQSLMHAASESELLQKTCDILVGASGYCQAWIGLAENDAEKSIRIAGIAGYEPGYLEQHKGTWATDGRHQGVMGHVIASGETYVTQNIWQDRNFSHRQQRAAERGYQSSLSLPLKIDGRCIGGISIYGFEPDAFDTDEIALLRELVDDVCFGINALRTRSARARAEAVLRESEQRARELFNQAAVGILLTSVDMKIIDLNQRFADIVGYSRQELIGASPVDITHAGDHEELRRSQRQLLNGEFGELSVQKRYLHKNGGVVWVNRTFSLARNESGEPQYFISVVEDITARKEIEQRLAITFDQAAVGIAQVSLDGRYLQVNRKFCEIVGYSEQELIGQDSMNITYPDDQEQVLRNRKLLTEGTHNSIVREKRYVRKDGRIIWAKRTISLARDAAGNPLYTIRVVEDITDRKEIEQRVNIAFNQASIGIAQVSMDGKYLLVNRKLCEILGYTAEEMVGRYVNDFVYQNDQQEVARNRARLVEGVVDSISGEKRYKTRDGRIIWCRRTMSLARDAAGQPLYTIRVIEDITAQKQAEESYRATVRQAPVGIFHSTLDLRITQVNPRLCEILGYSEEELLRLRVSEIVHPSNFGLHRDKFSKLARGELESFSLEQLFLRKDGSGLWVERMASAVRDVSGRTSHFIQVIQDISARREAEERERATVQQAPVGIVHNSLDGRILQVNPKFCEIVGYSEQELLALSNQDILHPEDRGRERDGLMKQLLAGEIPSFATEKRFVRKDGRVIFARRTVSVVRDATGKPLYLVRIIEDVTERMQAEERYRATFDNAPLGIMHSAPDRRILHVNDRLCEMLGYSKEELLRMTTADLLTPDYLEVDRANYWEAMLEGKMQTHSSRRPYLRKDGSLLWTNRTVSLVKDPAGKPLYFIRMIEDISARKRAEEALQINVERFEIVARATNDAVWDWDIKSGNLWWNKGFQHLFGYAEQDIKPGVESWYNGIHPDDKLRVVSGIHRVIDSRESSWSEEYRFRRADGSDAYVFDRGYVIRDENGAPLRMIGAMMDISERRRAEDVLRRKNELTSLLESLAVAANEARSPEQAMRTCLTRICDYTGWPVGHGVIFGENPADEKNQISLWALENAARWQKFKQASEPYRYASWAGGLIGNLIDTKRALWVRDVAKLEGFQRAQAAVECGIRSGFAFPVTAGDKVVAFLEFYSDEVMEPDESLMRVFNNIGAQLGRVAERRNAESALLASEETFRTAFSQASVGITVAALDQRYLQVNDKYCEITGYTREELLNDMSLVDLNLPEEVADAIEYRRKLLAGKAGGEVREKRLRRKNGTLAWIAVATSVVRGGGGEPRHFISVIQDISERREAERALRDSEERYRDLFDLAPQPIWVFDVETQKLVTANQAAVQKYGYTLAEFQGMSILDMQAEEDKTLVAQQLQERDPQTSTRYLRRHRTKSGETIVAEVLAKPLMFEGRPSRMILINDITERVRAEQALRDSEEQFRQLAGNIPQVFWISDATLRQTIYISPACEQMLGVSAADLRANPRRLVQAVHPEDRAKVKHARKSAASGNYDETYRVVRPDGSVRWIQDRAFPVRDAEGRVYRVAGIAEDITQRREAEEKLVYFAHYDGLTGLSNRVLFRDRLQQTMAQGRRRDWLVGVIMLDLDRFKIANDTLGHGAGDMLLKQVAARLTNCVRPGDTVGRFGGDEFGIILSDLRNAGDVRLVAQKILSTFAEPFRLDASEIHVTASLGISLYPSDSDDCDTLIKYADTALHRAKDSGRNNFQFYTTEMNVRALHRLNLENNLRHALERQEFLLHYQPKASLSRGVTTGLEALLRWQHPQFGLVSPVEFIPVLEETGLIIPVGEWVIGAVCAQIKSWQAAGIKPVPVAVNLSGRQFLAQDLGSTVKRLLAEHELDPGLIELEITESSLMVNTEEAIQTLEHLSSLGVSLAIDDFGTGYSSLSYLKRFPLDSLKIDRSFVRDITSDAEDAAITRAVISMAHSLGLKVVAEGVETEAQMSFLAANACDEIQGYYLARPLTPADCGKWLQQAQHISRPAILSGTQAPTVLLVDDDDDMLILIERALSQDGYNILTANDAGEGFEVLSKNRVDVVISDHEMPGMTGVEFLQRVKSLYPDTVRLMNSGHTDFQTVADAVNKGEVFRFVPKHADHRQLRMEIRDALAGRAAAAAKRGDALSALAGASGG
jgi:diguanylate cyclase (GGDEF)-like protein/PAS domain S-box-containing protein